MPLRPMRGPDPALQGAPGPCGGEGTARGGDHTGYEHTTYEDAAFILTKGDDQSAKKVPTWVHGANRKLEWY